MAGQYATRYRTHTAEELHQLEPGEAATVCGWFPGRKAGDEALDFLILDRFGPTSIRVPAESAGLHEPARALGPGDVVQVQGKVAAVESADVPVVLNAESIQVLSRSAALPLDVFNDRGAASRYRLADRLRYRYLDLRRPAMQQRLELRSRLMFEIRRYLIGEGVLEIDTPTLSRWSPEASTAFITPANTKRAFALSQTPQAFKQLLMIGGCDRYFQIARCFRQERVLTADRQLEYAALDLELSYVDEDDVMRVVDGLLSHLWTSIVGEELPEVPRISYDTALVRYGTERPDLRFGLEIEDLTDLAVGSGSGLMQQAVNAPSRPGGAVRAIRIPAELAAQLGEFGIGDVAGANPDPERVQFSWLEVAADESLTGPMADAFPGRLAPALLGRMQAGPGDLLVFFVGRNRFVVGHAAGRVRVWLGERLELIDPGAHAFVWVTSFPFWGYDIDGEVFVPARHPFTLPLRGDQSYLAGVGPLPSVDIFAIDPETGEAPEIPADLWTIRYGDEREDLTRIRTRSYELVMDGDELGTGSIRVHELELQEKILSMFGYTRQMVDNRFGFLLDAFKYGVPPHGGIAIGLDRMLARLVGVENIAEVIAFPKDVQGNCLVSGAPSPIDPEFLRSLFGQ